MSYRRKLAIKPIERLIENMEILDELIYNPGNPGYDEANKPNNESTAPTSDELLSFKIKMERAIRTISRKIERKIGFELPGGLKDKGGEK